MPWVGYELTIPVLERMNAVRSLDPAATVIGPAILIVNVDNKYWTYIYLRRWGLALSIGPNWVGFTWRRRQNPVSETLWFDREIGRRFKQRQDDG
jgi:hypothetical protein